MLESSISLFSSRFVETECSYQFDLTVHHRSVMSDKRMLSAVSHVPRPTVPDSEYTFCFEIKSLMTTFKMFST